MCLTAIIRRGLLSASVSDVKAVRLTSEFTLSDNVHIDSLAYGGITIHGQGEAGMILRIAPGTFGNPIFGVDARYERVENLTLEDFTMDGHRAANGQGILTLSHPDYGVYGIGASRVTARNFGESGFYFFGNNIRGPNLTSYGNDVPSFVVKDGGIDLSDIIRPSNSGFGLDITGGCPNWRFTTDVVVNRFVFEQNGFGGTKFGVADEEGINISARYVDGWIRNNDGTGFRASTFTGRDNSRLSVYFENVLSQDNNGIGFASVATTTHVSTQAIGNAWYGYHIS